MSGYEKKQVEKEFKSFTSRNFEKPAKCKNIDQVRFYVNELSVKITEFKSRFNYVPDHAYALLTQYNNLQNRMIFTDFKNTYL
ncbi:MAG: hypothetical protein OEX02_20975 [Cyclobacteriaceae bacterium]|nr:hypothetical protein [Cyclobacteriaceae bacterium]MDH5400640.1 hypothetical protein [Cyclobacteriaceae bacterium]